MATPSLYHVMFGWGSSSTNQNAALIMDHWLDFTKYICFSLSYLNIFLCTKTMENWMLTNFCSVRERILRTQWRKTNTFVVALFRRPQALQVQFCNNFITVNNCSCRHGDAVFIPRDVRLRNASSRAVDAQRGIIIFNCYYTFWDRNNLHRL